jgi:hypothetical protein
VRVAAIAAGVLILAAFVVVRTGPRSSRPSPLAGPTPSSPGTPAPPGTAPSGPSGKGPSGPPQPWPTASSACGSDTDLAIVASSRIAEQTGLRLLVGGSALRTVDFDSGRSTALTGVALRPGEFVRPAAPSLAVTSTCSATGPDSGSRLLRVGSGSLTALASLNSYVLVDGQNAWGVSLPDDPTRAAVLTPLTNGGGAAVTLPVGFAPAAIAGTTLIGNLIPAQPSADTRDDPLVLVNVASGSVVDKLGPGAFFAADDQEMLWTVGCRIGSGQPCTVHRRSISGGPVQDYQLPRPPGFAAGVISPDGRRVAFLMERAGQDPRYNQNHPLTPDDVVVMQLDTGSLAIVPNVELPAKAPPGLAFSSNGWLVIAINAGDATRLLAWRSALAEPYESAPVAGPGQGAPLIVALPGSPSVGAAGG